VLLGKLRLAMPLRSIPFRVPPPSFLQRPRKQLVITAAVNRIKIATIASSSASLIVGGRVRLATSAATEIVLGTVWITTTHHTHRSIQGRGSHNPIAGIVDRDRDTGQPHSLVSGS